MVPPLKARIEAASTVATAWSPFQWDVGLRTRLRRVLARVGDQVAQPAPAREVVGPAALLDSADHSDDFRPLAVLEPREGRAARLSWHQVTVRRRHRSRRPEVELVLIQLETVLDDRTHAAGQVERVANRLPPRLVVPDAVVGAVAHVAELRAQ